MGRRVHPKEAYGHLAANSLFSGALTYSTGWNEESCAVKAGE
jgi:hypothetical protein